MPDRQFVLEDPSLADIQFLEDQLYEFNSAETGIADGRSLAFFMRDAEKGIVAAAAGHTWGETCELQQLWVAESLRRQGIGRSLLEEVEAEAIRRGCRQLILSTHSFQAPRFYQNFGFEILYAIPEYPRGHSQILLRKGLRDRAA
jgi:ribosomal protein S18 acetylase RimI-like enzyme